MPADLPGMNKLPSLFDAQEDTKLEHLNEKAQTNSYSILFTLWKKHRVL